MARLPDSLANWRALDAQFGPEARIASTTCTAAAARTGARMPQRIVKVIEECGSDTVGLQEVDYRLDYIAHKLGMQPIPGLTLARHDGPFGNALITRRKVLAVRRLGFTYGGREPRNALDVDLEVAGETVRVIVTHLGLWPAERRYPGEADSEIAQGNSDLRARHRPGDINEWLPLGRPLRWMHALSDARPRSGLSGALAGGRARPRVGAAAARAARAQGASQPACRAGLRPPAGESARQPERVVCGRRAGFFFLPSAAEAWRGDRTRVA